MDKVFVYIMIVVLVLALPSCPRHPRRYFCIPEAQPERGRFSIGMLCRVRLINCLIRDTEQLGIVYLGRNGIGAGEW